MKIYVFPPIARLLATPALAVALCACSTTPTTVKQGYEGMTSRREIEKAPLDELLEYALLDPGSADSAYALGLFVERWHGRDPGASNLVEVGMTAAGGSHYRISFESRISRYPLHYFDQISPAAIYRVKKLQHHRRIGVGAPLVALRENTGREDIERFYPPEGIARPLTAVIHEGSLQGNVQNVRIDLICPLDEREVEIDGETRPLAADFSVPWAAMLQRESGLQLAQFFAFARSGRQRDPRLYLLEPYNPNKEPLIMIHGLLGTPLVWAELSNTLWDDEELRSRYQIWHFLYNTAAPALYSGRVLRDQLREVRQLLDPGGADPAMRSTTIIAHSMGAIIARTLLTKPRNAFADAAFTQPFGSLTLSGDDRASLKEAFFWDSTPHVKRAIYIAASHRGSDFADTPLGRFGRFAAKPPRSGFKDFYKRVSAANPGAFTKAYQELGRGRLNSIHALSPRQPSLPILASLPNNHPVREFSIIGTRGKPGPLQESSDGIVPYWSSHIARAESEKIVAASHHDLNHSATIAEVKRVLKLP